MNEIKNKVSSLIGSRIETYCPMCDMVRTFTYTIKPVVAKVRQLDIAYDRVVLRCDECGIAIFDDDIMEYNKQMAYEGYRSVTGEAIGG